MRDPLPRAQQADRVVTLLRETEAVLLAIARDTRASEAGYQKRRRYRLRAAAVRRAADMIGLRASP